MINPFKAVGSTVGGMFQSDQNLDFMGPTLPSIAAVLVTPIVAPVAFIAAFFTSKE